MRADKHRLICRAKAAASNALAVVVVVVAIVDVVFLTIVLNKLVELLNISAVKFWRRQHSQKTCISMLTHNVCTLKKEE